MSSLLDPGYLWRGARLLKTFVGGKISHANIQLTNRCNMRCGFCTFPERAVAPSAELTTEQWRSVSRKLSEAGSVVCSLEGGEPFLREDLVQIVEGFAQFHHPWLYTNGWYVTPELARDLWKNGLIEIGVSIDYATKEKHDQSRRLPGAFEKAVAAIKTLAACAPRGGRSVHILSILLHDNVAELEPLLELSKSLGVRHMFTLLSTHGIYRSARAQSVPREKVAPRIFELKKRYPHLAMFRSYVEGIDRYLDGNPPPCGAGISGMNIDHLGNVSSCIELADRNVASLVRDAWPEVERKLAAFSEPRSCTKCWTLCRGATEAMAGKPKLANWRDFVTEFVV
jgi:MoaA/NifB/PqqE/SkfB family radical SAM enzyme